MTDPVLCFLFCFSPPLACASAHLDYVYVLLLMHMLKLTFHWHQTKRKTNIDTPLMRIKLKTNFFPHLKWIHVEQKCVAHICGTCAAIQFEMNESRWNQECNEREAFFDSNYIWSILAGDVRSIVSVFSLIDIKCDDRITCVHFEMNSMQTCRPTECIWMSWDFIIQINRTVIWIIIVSFEAYLVIEQNQIRVYNWLWPIVQHRGSDNSKKYFWNTNGTMWRSTAYGLQPCKIANKIF